MMSEICNYRASKAEEQEQGMKEMGIQTDGDVQLCNRHFLLSLYDGNYGI